MANRDNFKKGSVEMLILHLLKEGDFYGYQLSQLIKQRSNEILVVPEGSMYPTLYRLIDKGCITDYKKQVGKRLTRVYYHLEPLGLDYLQELLGDYYRVNKGIQLLLNFKPEANSS
ncbi:PadR family transcriptional regulator [Lachnospiraceae bacterium ZAX-1]